LQRLNPGSWIRFFSPPPPAAISGFLYYVSFKGVTGANRLDVQAVKDKLVQIRASTELPVGVGFGIRDAETAAQVAAFSDAVVVGSALVNRVAALADKPDAIVAQAPQVIAEMRAAMDAMDAKGSVAAAN